MFNSCYSKSYCFKYADDGYLVVGLPGGNYDSVASEIKQHSDWASVCNLKLNATKSQEMVFCRQNCELPLPL